jgi:hydrogenase maturation protease
MSDITLLGIGNIILKDEGFGVWTIDKMQKLYEFPEQVQLLDGGTLGLELMRFVSGSKKMLVIDAINGNGKPGDFFFFTGDQVQAYFQEKISMHELGIQDVLSALQVVDEPIDEVIVMGVQPFVVSPGIEMTPEMDAVVDKTIEIVLDQLKKWDIIPTLRKAESLSV